MLSLRRTLAAFFTATAAASAATDFARDVYPVLQRACFECHDAKKQKGKLRLDSRAAALRGGDGGPAGYE
jgi:cytochrome c553